MKLYFVSQSFLSFFLISFERKYLPSWHTEEKAVSRLYNNRNLFRMSFIIFLLLIDKKKRKKIH